MTIEQEATNEYFEMNDGLSDMDYSYNPETKEYDIPALEWDGTYGTYWVKYASEEARQKALDEYNADLKAFVANKVESYHREKELLKSAKSMPKQATFTLGDLLRG